MKGALMDIFFGAFLALLLALILIKAVILRDCSLTSMVCSEDGGVP